MCNCLDDSEDGTDDLLTLFVHFLIDVEAEFAEFVLSGWGRRVASQQTLCNKEDKASDPKVQYHLSVISVSDVSCDDYIAIGIFAIVGTCLAQSCERALRVEAEDGYSDQSREEFTAA